MQRRLRTRGYELDRRGKVPPATLLRYLEHLRWEAVAEAPEVARTFEGGRRLVVVAQRLRLRREPALAEELELELQIEKVGRTSLEFGHRIQTAAGESIAEARVTAVQLGPDGRPAAIADAIHALARPSSLEGAFPAPLADAPLAGAWAHRFGVRPSDLDLLEHVNHANYLVYAEDARALAAAAGALSPAPLRAVTLEYRRQAVLGDELEARVLALGEREVAFQLGRGEELLCAGRIELG
jgi:acyl-CoA thioesterase FadM